MNPSSNESHEPHRILHLRQKPFAQLPTDCSLVVAVPRMRSRVNLSRIVRAAGCSGVKKLIVEGNQKIDPEIARDAATTVNIENRNSLAPAVARIKKSGFQIVALEQTNQSIWIHEHRFRPDSVLVLGHERNGIDQSLLDLADVAVEIPVFGLPYSFNVATAAALGMYEFNRQFFSGAQPANRED